MSAEKLRALLNYDQETGVFTWRKDSSVAGAPRDERGYIRIGVLGKRWHAHRLAFVWMTGSCPSYVDHIDGNMGNNAWANLRAATKSQNGMNRGANKNNSTGFKGVYFQANGYTAEVRKDGVKYYLGRFKSAVEAAKAAERARDELHGEFAHG